MSRSLAVLRATKEQSPFDALCAAAKALPDDLEGLIRAGADANEVRVDDVGNESSALRLATYPGQIRALLQAGARAGAKECLQARCANRGSSGPNRVYLNELSVRLLVEAGTDVNWVHRGMTPLHHAAESGLANAVKTLPSARADAAAETGAGAKAPGLTARALAEKNKHRAVAELLDGSSP